MNTPVFQRRAPEARAELTPEARKVESAVLRAFADLSQAEVSRATGISETRLSRFKSDASDGGGLSLPEVAAVLAALGLCVLRASHDELVTLPAEEVCALRTLARRYLGDPA